MATRDCIGQIIDKTNPILPVNKKDANFIFLRFVGDHLPAGLVELVVAVIFLAAWGSVAQFLQSGKDTFLLLYAAFLLKSVPRNL